MRTKLTWLHISDIHYDPRTEWRDSTARDSLIDYLKELFRRDGAQRPDLIFCTGDIAYGEADSSPLTDQYNAAKLFFDKLLTVSGLEGAPLPRERLFVVPGNHDVNRKCVNPDAQETLARWATKSSEHVETINQRYSDRPLAFGEAIKRLDEYAQFVDSYLPHLRDEDRRHQYTRIVDLEGVRVGIAGFNSAWSCSGPEDDRALWLAAEWQFNAAKNMLKDATVRIGLMHHPVDWLNSADREIATRRISTDFHFWLHGHTHSAWVVPTQSSITIAAGAIGAQTSVEFGINLVQIDLTRLNGIVFLHQRKAGGTSWTIAPVEVHAPEGQWQLETLPHSLRIGDLALPFDTSSGTPVKRIIKVFGRNAILKEARDILNLQSFLLVYGLRGIGKSALIAELGKNTPLAGKENVYYRVSQSTNRDELYRQFAVLLGDTSEFPRSPQGDSIAIAEEIMRRYPDPRPSWIWIDGAHHLIDSGGFREPEIRNLLLGLYDALGTKWHWVLELRERPPQGLLGTLTCECEVPGLDKASLGDCLGDGAPFGRESEWLYTGGNLKKIYQWLGGGHGNQAHPQAIQLLIEVARGRKETPLEVLERHRGDLEEKIESKLLGDLYFNVLKPHEQIMLQALALYRVAIPHDHADALEKYLSIPGAWDGLDRRCLLSSNADHSQFFLHSFIAGWVRARSLGYAGHGEDVEVDFMETTPSEVRQHAQALHKAIAKCWLDQLGDSRRATNLNIGRALESFHHLVSAGDCDRVQEIAVNLLSGNIDWARQRMKTLYKQLFQTNAPVAKQREVLEYRAALDPEDHMVQRFLGQCWLKEEGRRSDKALKCFENACHLRRDYPQYWADLGRTLLARGREGAVYFLARLESLERDCPKAIDDYVRSIQADCFTILGQFDQATKLRMEKIRARSSHPTFYNDEAKARLDSGNPQGALEILDLAEKNGCANDYTTAVRTTIIQHTDPEKASALRIEKIRAGSHDHVFYNDEAKARLNAGNPQGALEILDLAEKNGCADDSTTAIRTSVLQHTDPEKTFALRMEKIRAGSRHPAFYNDEAQARLNAGNSQGALEILDLAENNGCADDFTTAIRTTAIQHADPEKASALRMEKISAGSRNPVFYADEAKARLDAGNLQGALEILDLAEKYGCANDFTTAIRTTVIQLTNPGKATSLRMEKIRAGSRHPAFYADEAKARLDAGNPQGALEILDLAEKNGCGANDYMTAIRVKVLIKSGDGGFCKR